MIFDVIIHNVNVISKSEDLDLCGDETTWPYEGYGEQGAQVVGQTKGKHGIIRGGQSVIIMDTMRMRPRAIILRHNQHTKPSGFTIMANV